MFKLFSILLRFSLLTGVLTLANEEVYGKDEEVSFNYDIRPIMSDTCFLCHGPDEGNREADLRLDIPELAYADRDGSRAIVPGDPDESLILWMINAEDEEDLMPPPKHPRSLTEDEKKLFRTWIEQGAKYEKHWSLISPKNEIPPTVSDSSWIRNPIDQFVLNKLEDSGLKPSTEADRTTLIRRVTLDLTGLPPTVDEIDAFVADERSDAYERLVDELLSRVSYAERMTNEWMDVARYADSHGYSQDFIRDMSPYRDWVISAFHENMPFDQFAQWQLAGDLLPNATVTQKLATGFNRLHPQNSEGGIVNEEFRVEYAAERVQTLGAAFLGFTLECSRCHDHKYDPISQKNFYELFSFFNNIDDSGQISFEESDMPVPTLLLPNSEEVKALNELDEAIEKHSLILESTIAESEHEFKKWMSDVTPDQWELSGKDALVAYFPLEPDDTTASIQNALDAENPGRVMFGAQLNEEQGPNLMPVPHGDGTAFQLNGDDALYFPSVNFFRRGNPFSVGIQAWLPKSLNEGVLFHFNKAGILYNYKGFEVSLTDGYWEVRMAHSFPYNSIQMVSNAPAEKERWQHVMLTYDGSSRAAGLKLYVDGKPVLMRIERDRLYKNILSNKEGVRKEIGLKVGARMRSRGLPGARVDEINVYNRALAALEVASLAGQVPRKLAKESIQEFFLVRYQEDYRSRVLQLSELRNERNDLNEWVREVMVMEELPEPRQAYILRRGAYDAQMEPVFPNTPEAILPFDKDLPANRLGLAKWLVDPENPLTARVTINRYWQMLFGQGIVGTPEDFGNQGQLPSHPKLLDWLAWKFMDSGWDIKAMMTLLVTSSTYRQSSKVDPELLKMDPGNRLLARGPIVRMSAEMIRDNALAASGLLVRTIGGPSVYPYQPPDLWNMNKGTYVEGTGEDLYRRSLYTVWKRTVPPPSMNNFDAPDRSYCVVRRQQTNTPLQALSLMNDPQFVEASRVLAERVLERSDETDQALILAYRSLTSRFPGHAELEILCKLYNQLLESYKGRVEKVNALLAVGEMPVSETADREKLAALALVASMIMNHDATVVKR